MVIIFKVIIIIIRKIAYIVLINRIIIILAFDVYILIIKFKLDIDIDILVYFNYEKLDYVRKDCDV